MQTQYVFFKKFQIDEYDDVVMINLIKYIFYNAQIAPDIGYCPTENFLCQAPVNNLKAIMASHINLLIYTFSI